MTYEKIIHDDQITALIRYGTIDETKPMKMQVSKPSQVKWTNDREFVSKYVYQLDDIDEEYATAPSGFNVEIREAEADQIQASWKT